VARNSAKNSAKFFADAEYSANGPMLIWP